MMIKLPFFGASASLSFLLLTVGSSLPAKVVAAESDSMVEEVVVTARRREEGAQDVPVSLSLFSGDDLEALEAPDLTYINQLAPNVTLERSRSTNSTLTAFMRGVGQQDPVAGFEAGVGIYLDDVYLNRPQGAVLDIYDVERIEVLRGPQGTLYGRNTIGGALKYVTRRLAQEPEARIKMAVGSYNQLDVVGTFGVPISDDAAIGGSFARFSRDGFGDNLEQSGVDNYNKDTWAGRLSFEWSPGDDWFIRLAGDYTQDDSDPRNGHRLIPAQFTPGFPVLDDVFDTQADLDIPDTEATHWGVTASVDWDLNDAVLLRNILAYRDNETDQQIDFDSLPVPDLQSPFHTEDDQFTYELQALFSYDAVEAVAGFYYIDADASNHFDVLLAQVGDLIGLPGLNAFTLGDVNTKSWSAFGDASFELTELFGWGGENTESLELSVGGRYTNDKRSARVLRETYIGGHSPFFGGDGFPIATTSDFDDSETFTDFSPRVSISWQPNTPHMFYLSWSEGFKGGGFDPRGQTSATPDFDDDGVVTDDEVKAFMQFEPEEITTWEIGAKSAWLDGRVTTSVALFTSDYRDVQIPGSIGVDSNGDGVVDTFAGITTNAGKASMTGIEFEGSATIAEDWITSGDTFATTWAIGWIDAKFDEYIEAVTDEDGNTSLVDVSSERNIQNTPEWTASLVIDYRFPLASGELGLINVISYRDDVHQFEFDSPIDQKAYTLWDASILWTSEDGKVRVGVYGKNLTDKEYKVAGYDFIDLNLGLEGTLTAFYGNPRTISGVFEYRF